MGIVVIVICSFVIFNAVIMDLVFESRLVLLNFTNFGLPVLPDVERQIAIFCSERSDFSSGFS